MSRRGNCHENAVAESFFQLLTRERMIRKINTNRYEASNGCTGRNAQNQASIRYTGNCAESSKQKS